MSVGSRIVSRLFDLPAPVTRDVRPQADLIVRTRDGVNLMTNHYEPLLGKAPTILIRSPYGRSGLVGLVSGRVLAEHGFHVIMQSCRGTFGSGGTFEPMRYEREDGLDTIAWIKEQPWFDGTLFTYGPSYVGFTQWAIADAPEVSGAVTVVTSSTFRDPTYAGGAFSLDTVLNWATLIGNQASGSMLRFLLKQANAERKLSRAWNHVPLREADEIALGHEVPFFREWLANGDDDAYWSPRSHDHRLPSVTAPICMVGGWYDIFLPWQLADYARLRAAGARPRLVIGAWTHVSRELLARSMREGIDWFRTAAQPDRATARVELYVGGADEWRTYEDWPPAARTQEWFFGPQRSLSPTGTDIGEIGRFRFDPADPTPSPGGPLLTEDAGKVDNSAVEARDDVLVYTSDVLTEDLEAIGPVMAEFRLASSSPYFDIFVRLCDVTPDGRSENVCDGLTRVGGEESEENVVQVELWPTAYRWKAGHRIRVQIAGAAHPRYARNPGTGEPLGAGTEMRTVEHAVLSPSFIRLPRPA